MGFIDKLIEENLPIWQQCVETEFLQRLGDCTLSEDCFKGYIVEDSLYLREYAKVFAWGMVKATDMAEIRAYYSLLAFINESEDATRLQYLQRYGLTDEQIQPLPQRPENKAYTQTMIEAVKDGGGAAECMAACLPCMIGYGWMFQRLLEQYPGVRETLYWPLVRDYVDAGYERICRQWIAFSEQICQGLPPARLEHCREIFHACSVHELHFWEMSAKPRTDI